MIFFIKKVAKLTAGITRTINLPMHYHALGALIYVTVLNILVISCKDNVIRDIPLQGTIEYDISYIENNSNGISERILPKKMVVTFNDQFVMQRIDGLMGLFSIFHITCHKERTNNTYLKVGPYKYTYKGSPDEMAAGFGFNEKKEIKTEEGYFRIAGFDAQKALVTKPGSYNETYTVFYSNDFPLQNINKFNPYKEIEGILLDFRLEINGLKMHLVAKEAKFNEIDEKIFFPEDYRRISRKDMDELINALLE